MKPRPGPGGLVIVDKPAGMTSHDVVGRVRKLAGTRKVGHAGTLDPMATGVLVVGIGRATRLLGYLAGGDKSYRATIRLGVATDTDDATGTPATAIDASGISDPAIAAGVATLTGEIDQIPSTVSAIKVEGKRAYDLARAGAEVELAARRVTVSRFAVLAIRRGSATVDVDVEVACSRGTYVRALARDLGSGLGVGGHLTALRRTRVGPFDLDGATTLDALAERFALLPLDQVARLAFEHRVADDAEAVRILTHGGWLPAEAAERNPVAMFGPDGRFLALVEIRAGRAHPVAVFADPEPTVSVLPGSRPEMRGNGCASGAE